MKLNDEYEVGMTWNDHVYFLCIVLYCIALHCIALHCIALHCIALLHIFSHALDGHIEKKLT